MPKVYTSRDINAVLKRQLGVNRAVRVGGVKGHHAICVAVDEDAKITVEGIAGDFFAALNDRASIRLVGRAGRYAGDSMAGGELIIEGDADDGVGCCMGGGNLLVKGNAGLDAGAGMRDGVLIVNGDAGDNVGRRMLGGMIIITGNSGKDVGRGMRGGEIYVANEVEGIGRGAVIGEAAHEEKRAVANILEKYEIKAKLALFEKICPEVAAEEAMGIFVEVED